MALMRQRLGGAVGSRIGSGGVRVRYIPGRLGCVRFLMGNAFVAIDASLSLVFGISVLAARAAVLFREVHVAEIVAGTTLPGVRCLHLGPDPARHLPPTGLVFLRGVDGPHELVIDVLGRDEFGEQLGKEGLRDMAVGTGGPDARGVLVVGALLKFSEGDLHGVAVGAEFLSVGESEAAVEQAGADDAGQEHGDDDNEGSLTGKVVGHDY